MLVQTGQNNEASESGAGEGAKSVGFACGLEHLSRLGSSAEFLTDPWRAKDLTGLGMQFGVGVCVCLFPKPSQACEF